MVVSTARCRHWLLPLLGALLAVAVTCDADRQPALGSRAPAHRSGSDGTLAAAALPTLTLADDNAGVVQQLVALVKPPRDGGPDVLFLLLNSATCTATASVGADGPHVFEAAIVAAAARTGSRVVALACGALPDVPALTRLRSLHTAALVRVGIDGAELPGASSHLTTDAALLLEQPPAAVIHDSIHVSFLLRSEEAAGGSAAAADASLLAKTTSRAAAWLQRHTLPTFTETFSPAAFRFASRNASTALLALAVVWRGGAASEGHNAAFVSSLRAVALPRGDEPALLPPDVRDRFLFGVLDGATFARFVGQFGLPVDDDGTHSLPHSVPGARIPYYQPGAAKHPPQLLVLDASNPTVPLFWLDPAVREGDDMATFLGDIVAGREVACHSIASQHGAARNQGTAAGLLAYGRAALARTRRSILQLWGVCAAAGASALHSGVSSALLGSPPSSLSLAVSSFLTVVLLGGLVAWCLLRGDAAASAESDSEWKPEREYMRLHTAPPAHRSGGNAGRWGADDDDDSRVEGESDVVEGSASEDDDTPDSDDGEGGSEGGEEVDGPMVPSLAQASPVSLPRSSPRRAATPPVPGQLQRGSSYSGRAAFLVGGAAAGEGGVSRGGSAGDG